jgi:hypothetical protein
MHIFADFFLSVKEGSGDQRILTDGRENILRRVPGFAKTNNCIYWQAGENLFITGYLNS